MTPTRPVYLEIIDFIASGVTPDQLLAFHPSAEAQNRVHELIAREREGALSEAEKSELEHFMELEHILRMAKAKAREVRARGV